MGAIAVLVGFAGHVLLGLYGFVHLRQLRLSLASWLVVLLSALLLPLPIKFLFYNAYAGESVSSYEFLVSSIWMPFLPFTFGYLLKELLPRFSGALLLALLPSILYFLMFHKFCLAFFNISPYH